MSNQKQPRQTVKGANYTHAHSLFNMEHKEQDQPQAFKQGRERDKKPLEVKVR